MKIILTEDQIQNITINLADDLTARHSSNEKIVMICLLKGGFMFFSDLTKQIKTPIQCDFMRVKSYVGKHEQGDIQILKDIETPIKNKIVYVVDDFFDTGNTMDAVVEYLSQKQPKRIEAITLLTRDISPLPEYRLYYGHIIRDEWVVGYGLDNNGLERNLPYIYAL
jgi:hypoxanthine phosphoribosyltransferase